MDYPSISARRPDLIYASITGFGSTAGAHLPGYDLCVQALSGLMSIQGAPDGEGYRSGFALFDVFAGMYATVGILAALQDRTRTGLGQHIEVNLMNVAMAAMVNQTMAFAAGDVVPRAMGNEHPSLVPLRAIPHQGPPTGGRGGQRWSVPSAVRRDGPRCSCRRRAIRDERAAQSPSS